MEPIFNPKITSEVKSRVHRHWHNVRLGIATLTFFQKIVIGLLLINLVVTHAALEAAQEAAQEASWANSSADDAARQAREAEQACDTISRY